MRDPIESISLAILVRASLGVRLHCAQLAGCMVSTYDHFPLCILLYIIYSILHQNALV